MPLFPSSLEPFHILVFNLTTKVIYKDFVTTAFDFNQKFSSYNVAVVFNDYVLTYGGDFLNLTYLYTHKLSTLGLIRVSIILSFRFNYTSSSYDLSISSSYVITSPTSMNVKTMLISNGVVLMQMHNTCTLRLHGQNVNYHDYLDPYILQKDILEFFYFSNSYYILFTKGLIRATIDEVNGVFLSTSFTDILPYNLYQLTFGISLDILFIPGTPYIYKARCINQTVYSSGTCVSYTCTVPDCDVCPLTASTCESCANGLTKNDYFTCVQVMNVTSPPAPIAPIVPIVPISPANTTNNASTPVANTTIFTPPSNFTANSTNSPTNDSTNSPINGSANGSVDSNTSLPL